MVNKKENVLDVFGKLGDIKFQAEVWLNGNYWDRVTDYGEAVNTLDDYWFFDDVKNNIMKLTPEEHRFLTAFLDDLLTYEPKNVAFMLEDDHWKRMVEYACRISEILKKYSW